MFSTTVLALQHGSVMLSGPELAEGSMLSVTTCSGRIEIHNSFQRCSAARQRAKCTLQHRISTLQKTLKSQSFPIRMVTIGTSRHFPAGLRHFVTVIIRAGALDYRHPVSSHEITPKSGRKAATSDA
jgi:hypothetical protein